MISRCSFLLGVEEHLGTFHKARTDEHNPNAVRRNTEDHRDQTGEDSLLLRHPSRQFQRVKAWEKTRKTAMCCEVPGFRGLRLRARSRCNQSICQKLKGGQPARCFCRCYISLGASSLCLLGHSQFRDRSSSPQSSSVALVVLVLMDRDRTSGSERSEVLPFHFWWNRA